MTILQRSITQLFSLSGCLTLLVLLTGCADLRYYMDISAGHFELMSDRKEIAAILKDPHEPQALRDKLATLLAIRTFAIEQVGLPDNGSYLHYKDLQRPYAQWTLFATPAYSLQPIPSCFWVVGCVNYRVYFSEAKARKQASLLDKNIDYYLGNSPAYSTLGWFHDPVLNSMLSWSDAQTAEFLFHELAHQRFYIKNESAINESFAVAVEQIAVRQWLQASNRHKQLTQYERQLDIEKQFSLWIANARRDLEKLYANPSLSDTEKKAQKAQIFARLQDLYREESRHWEKPYYKKWFAQELNNAHLLAISTYSDYVPAFLALFAQSKQQWPVFFAAAQRLEDVSPEERRQRLQALGHF